MIREEPELGPFLDHALVSVREQTLELCQMKLRSSVQRLAAFLLGLVEDPAMNPARFVLPYEKRFLAARIGCTQENLSRAFAALRRLGVETQRGIVVLRDVPALPRRLSVARNQPLTDRTTQRHVNRDADPPALPLSRAVPAISASFSGSAPTVHGDRIWWQPEMGRQRLSLFPRGDIEAVRSIEPDNEAIIRRCQDGFPLRVILHVNTGLILPFRRVKPNLWMSADRAS